MCFRARKRINAPMKIGGMQMRKATRRLNMPEMKSGTVGGGAQRLALDGDPYGERGDGDGERRGAAEDQSGGRDLGDRLHVLAKSSNEVGGDRPEAVVDQRWSFVGRVVEARVDAHREAV